jgi:hypothetical protein
MKSALARAATKTVWISRCSAKKLRIWPCQRWHSSLSSFVRSFAPAVLNGQPARVSEIARQRLDWATTSIPARQCSAWLSPSRATVALARSGATPK